MGLRIRGALIVQGDNVEGSKNWLAGLRVKPKTGEEFDAFVSMSVGTGRFVQKDNFGTMMPVAVQDGKILDSSVTEPMIVGRR